MNLTLNNSLMGMSVGSCSVSFRQYGKDEDGGRGCTPLLLLFAHGARNWPSFIAVAEACVGCSGNIAATDTCSIDSCTDCNISTAAAGIGIGTDSSSRYFEAEL